MRKLEVVDINSGDILELTPLHHRTPSTVNGITSETLQKVVDTLGVMRWDMNSALHPARRTPLRGGAKWGIRGAKTYARLVDVAETAVGYVAEALDLYDAKDGCRLTLNSNTYERIVRALRLGAQEPDIWEAALLVVNELLEPCNTRPC
jgi:hypothetical protein